MSSGDRRERRATIQTALGDTAVQRSGDAGPGPRAAAPTYAGIDDQLADARSRLRRVERAGGIPGGALRPSGARRHPSRGAAGGRGRGRGAPATRSSSSATCWSGASTHATSPGCPSPDSRHAVLVLCQEGYTSSLAADALLRLGVTRATDVEGGFRAWREAGLPTAQR